MNDQSINNCKKELLEIYSKLGFFVKIYTYIRILTTPLFEIEKYVPKSGRILDIGCGMGIFSNLLCLMSESRSAIGFDISRKRVDLAKTTAARKKQLSSYVQDAKDVNFDGFSIITIVDLLHHMPYSEQEDVLRKAYLGLESPGTVVLKDLEKKPIWKYFFHYVQDSISCRSKLFFRSSMETINLLDDIGFTVTVIPIESFLPYPNILYLCEK